MKKKLNKKLVLIPIVFVLAIIGLGAQQSFSDYYNSFDPVEDYSDPEKVLSMHHDFLEDALSKNDTTQIIFGNLYLFYDYKIAAQYTKAMDHLIAAEVLASIRKDTLVLGRINHKKGGILAEIDNVEEAIALFETALVQNKIAQDSQYIAITMEQLAINYSDLGDYDKTNRLYTEAIPLIEKYCKPRSMAIALINYGVSLEEQGEIEKAIHNYKEALVIAEKHQYGYEVVLAKINLAMLHSKDGDLDLAIKLFHESEKANKKNGWDYHQIYTYEGLSSTFDKKGLVDSAFYYYQKYHILEDSIMGTQIQNQLNQLETESVEQKKNIEILSLKEKTLTYKQKLKSIIIGALVVFTLISWLAWYAFHKNRKSQLMLTSNRNALKEMTTLLARKNSELQAKSEALKKEENPREDVIPPNEESQNVILEEPTALDNIDYYDMTILTEDDWTSFKALFNKSYPNYLQKIRGSFPNISPAEERLFIFIKVGLSTQESANILGIKPETIKKTRYRLRKKLGLEKDDNINTFIQNF